MTETQTEAHRQLLKGQRYVAATYLYPEDHAVLASAAERRGLSISALLRAIVLERLPELAAEGAGVD